MACLGTPSSSVDGVLRDGGANQVGVDVCDEDQRHDSEEFQSSGAGAERARGAGGMAATLMGRNPSQGWGVINWPVLGEVRSDLMGPYGVDGAVWLDQLGLC
jgi:hypothetical protein